MNTLTLGLRRGGLEIRAFFRETDSLVFSFLFPLVMLGIFSVAFGNGQSISTGPDGAGDSISFAHYYLPNMLASGLILSSLQTLGIAIAQEREDGTLKRLRGTPLPAVSYFLGKIVLVLVCSVAQAILLLLFANFAFDVPLPNDVTHWARLVWVFLLGSATGTVLGIAISSLPRSGKAATGVVLPIVLILQFISGVFFPFFNLPTWLQMIASVFPLRWMAQGMRSALLPESLTVLEPDGTWELGMGAVVMTIWLVLGLLLCRYTFRWIRADQR